MRNGQVFELQMPMPHTKDSESSSLPTPKARDHQAEGYEAGLRRSSPQVGTILKGLVEGDERVLLRSPTASQGQGGALGEAEARRRGNTVGIRDQAMDLAKLQGYKVSREVANLPTPTTRDYKDGSADHARDGKVQTDTVARAIFSSGEVKLFPTPLTTEAKASNSPGDLNRESPRLGTVIHQVSGALLLTKNESTKWGKFEAAIRRWETTIGRPAPAPTKPDGKEGNHRLSSKFTEWMMGLPDGWITNVGLTRNEELKLAGNVVVPQQAELALKILLENTPPR
jgi:DNA (cytosine-5)-methyltransferase 1